MNPHLTYEQIRCVHSRKLESRNFCPFYYNQLGTLKFLVNSLPAAQSLRMDISKLWHRSELFITFLLENDLKKKRIYSRLSLRRLVRDYHYRYYNITAMIVSFISNIDNFQTFDA